MGGQDRKRGWGIEKVWDGEKERRGYRKGVKWREREDGGIEKVWDGEKERIGVCKRCGMERKREEGVYKRCGMGRKRGWGIEKVWDGEKERMGDRQGVG